MFLLPVCSIGLNGFYYEVSLEQKREKIFCMENTFANNEKSIVKIARKRFSTAFLFDTYTRSLLHGCECNLVRVFRVFYILLSTAKYDKK